MVTVEVTGVTGSCWSFAMAEPGPPSDGSVGPVLPSELFTDASDGVCADGVARGFCSRKLASSNDSTLSKPISSSTSLSASVVAAAEAAATFSGDAAGVCGVDAAIVEVGEATPPSVSTAGLVSKLAAGT